MRPGDNTDVTSTLTELERKLVDLERELSAVAGGDETPAAPAPAVATPTPVETRDAALRVEDLRGEIADLVRFRDQLEAAAHELVSEYDRLVERLRGSTLPGAAAPGGERQPADRPPPAGGPARAPAPQPRPGAEPRGAAPPAPAPRAESTGADDGTSFVGSVAVDAGPFNDITTLQSFEQALARIEGAEDVYVRSFEGNRALIDVRLSNPVPLVRLLRERLPLPITATDTGEGRLTVDVAADPHGT